MGQFSFNFCYLFWQFSKVIVAQLRPTLLQSVNDMYEVTNGEKSSVDQHRQYIDLISQSAVKPQLFSHLINQVSRPTFLSTHDPPLRSHLNGKCTHESRDRARPLTIYEPQHFISCLFFNKNSCEKLVPCKCLISFTRWRHCSPKSSITLGREELPPLYYIAASSPA